MSDRAVTIELSRAQAHELRDLFGLDRGGLDAPKLLRAVRALKVSLVAAADSELAAMRSPNWTRGERKKRCT